MIEPDTGQARPAGKKSVALSGTAAGNTAICTVGHTGNDLQYRGYDIRDFADSAEFEEIAHLLIHERLPSAAELADYKQRLRTLRGLPPALERVLEQLPASAQPMDVLRTGCSALGTLEPERAARPAPAPSATGCWRASRPCSCTGTTTARTAGASR